MGVVSSPRKLNNPERTLIQRGGGTGPVKPQQPDSDQLTAISERLSANHGANSDRRMVLEDERALMLTALPFLSQKGNFFFWR